MLDLAKDSGPKPRCLVTNTKLSNFLNHEQPPTKKRPFSTILNQTFTHSLTLLLPTQLNTFQECLKFPISPHTLHYSKLHLKLSELLKNPFFSTYMKSPPTDLLAITHSPSGNTYTLCQGLLTLDLDRPTYERTGLQNGKVVPTGGRRHAKERFRVELNLRLPSMLHGKKGFDRILWAFENVLNETCTFLVCDAKAAGVESLVQGSETPIMHFAPLERVVRAEVTELGDVLVPPFPEVKEEEYAEAAELLEWLGLAMLGSPRIREDDDVDAHFSRYRVLQGAKARDLTKFTWRGLVPAEFAYKVFLASLKASGEEWVAMSASSFEGESYTILVNRGDVVIWEYKD